MDSTQAQQVLADYISSLSAEITGHTQETAKKQEKIDAANIAINLLTEGYQTDQARIDADATQVRADVAAQIADLTKQVDDLTAALQNLAAQVEPSGV